MEDIDREKIIERWKSIMGDESLGDYNSATQSATQSESSFDGIAFPIVRKVVAQTLGGPTVTEEDRNKIIEENRIGKIESIIDDVKFEPKEVPEINPGIVPVKPLGMPQGNLFYMDFKYESSGTSSNIDT